MTYLHFGIRDLLWAMVVVGLVIGWWVDRAELARSYDELVLRTIKWKDHGGGASVVNRLGSSHRE